MPICRQCKHIADCQLDAIVNNLTFDPNFNAENCIDFEMFSNADRIRAMSDKELAWFLAERYAKESVLRLSDSGVEPTATKIKAVTEQLYYTWLRWLDQPVEEDKAEKYEIDKLFSSGIMSKEELRNLMAQQWGVE